MPGRDGNDDAPVVLVIEDERDLADLYSRWLSDEYSIRTAYTGEDALSLIDSAVDVLVLDRRLPDLAGDEILGRIRERGHDCAVAMVTGVSPDVDILKLDIDEYLTKPVSQDDLLEVIDELVARRSVEEGLQDYFALASKKRALESEKTPVELRQSTEYEILRKELANLRDQFDTELLRHTETTPDSYLRYPGRRAVGEGVVIGTFAVLLVGIHAWLPDAATRILETGDPGSNFLIALLGTFVHVNDVHLYSNVIGYLVGAFFSYLICLRLSAARWFHVTAPLLVVGLPVITGVMSVGITTVVYPDWNPIFLGVSNIVAGFIGFSFLAFLLLVRTVFDHRSVLYIATFMFLGTLATLFRFYEHPLGSVTAVAGVVAFALFVKDNAGDVVPEDGWGKFGNQVGVILGVTGVYIVFGLGLFPTSQVRNAQQVWILGHFLGTIVGFTIALSTAFLVNLFPVRDRIQRAGYSLPTDLL